MRFFTDLRNEEIPLKILVSGATGFVGSNIVNQLTQSKENEITIISYGNEPLLKGVHKVLSPSLDGIDWKQVYGHDVLIHQMANNDTRCLDHEEMWRANVFGPISLFTRMFDGGCRKFVYASSTAVYGNSPAPYFEDTTKVAPLNVYGRSKAQFDEFAMKFAEEKGVSVVGLRYCNVYGPGEERKGKRMSMVGQLMKQISKGRRPKIFKDGTQKRDWVYVDDVVQANLLAMTRSPISKGSIYNIGSGHSISFNGLIDLIQQQYQREKTWIDYIDCPFPEEYQSYTECNIEKARRELGFSPGFNLRSGINSYFEYMIKTSSSCTGLV